ncbi:MAG: ABC transporter ATP-binding protein [Desulfocapsa sp.]|nr:MAG: ABC transporter ATP-binding protein [Desulfocapsa sp.]
MISIHGLSKQYKTHTALDGVSLEVKEGIILGLLGPNGAGKTTLVSILNCLLPYQEGTISIFGLPLRENQREIRRRSSFIPQAFAFYDNLTVMENLRFFAGIQKIHGKSLQQRLDSAITANRLQTMLRKRACSLSGGQKQRLNIAIGLLNDPEIIYFDEPTAGIDPELRNSILESILSFKNEGKTILYTSHYMQEIEQICDEAAIIHHGKIICHEPLSTLLRRDGSKTTLESIYLSLTAAKDEPC